MRLLLLLVLFVAPLLAVQVDYKAVANQPWDDVMEVTLDDKTISHFDWGSCSIPVAWDAWTVVPSTCQLSLRMRVDPDQPSHATVNLDFLGSAEQEIWRATYYPLGSDQEVYWASISIVGETLIFRDSEGQVSTHNIATGQLMMHFSVVGKNVYLVDSGYSSFLGSLDSPEGDLRATSLFTPTTSVSIEKTDDVKAANPANCVLRKVKRVRQFTAPLVKDDTVLNEFPIQAETAGSIMMLTLPVYALEKVCGLNPVRFRSSSKSSEHEFDWGTKGSFSFEF